MDFLSEGVEDCGETLVDEDEGNNLADEYGEAAKAARLVLLLLLLDII